jgi:hypothetical protein
MKKVALSALLSSIVMVLIVVNGLLLPAQKAQAEFLQVADLPTVVVAVDPSLVHRAHPFIVQAWVLLDFKQDQPANTLGLERPSFGQYRSRLDRVEVNCRHGHYARTAVTVFGQPKAGGQPVYEAVGLRSPNWREMRPFGYESAIWSYVCQGVSNIGPINPPRPL